MARLNPEEFLYIPLSEDSKRPIMSWGGWPIDPTHEAVVTYNETQESEHNSWGIVGNKDQDLLVIDLDLYKMDEHTRMTVENDDFAGKLDQTTVIGSQSGGRHIYFKYDGDLEDYKVMEHVDLGGDVGTRYMKSFESEKYQILNDETPAEIEEKHIKQFSIFTEKVTNQKSHSANLQMPTLAAPCIKNAIREENEVLLRALFHTDENGVHHTGGSVYDLLNRGQYPEGVNKAAPNWMHATPSHTGSNFKVHEGGELFRCWRHDISGNVYHLVGIKEGIIECTDRDNWDDLTKQDWHQIFNAAEKYGIESKKGKVTCEKIQENDMCPRNCGRSHPLEDL